jgi:cell division protein FtsI (penicillin-binding protein 3)
MKADDRRTRFASTAGIFSMLFVVALGRVFQLCVWDGAALRALAGRQHQQHISLLPERGAIVDRHGDVLALTLESAAVYVRPAAFDATAGASAALARTLDLAPDVVAKKLDTTAPFVWLQRRATREQAEAVAALGVHGVGSQPSRQRFFPRGSLAGQVVGFANVDSRGIEGVELAYDAALRGAPGSLSMERDARGRPMWTEPIAPPVSHPGARVELTLDATLQQVAEDELNAAVTAHHAAAGVAIVMDPATGEILALANAPRFDPNHVQQFTADRWRNRVTADTYEPGSTFKGILAAAAIEAGVVRPEDRIFCENGSLRIGKRVVHDHEPYGWLTFADVIKHSSNIGAAKVGERLGAARLSAAIEAFGFGSVTHVDLPGEVAGRVRPGDKWARIHLVTTSFGQGIAVTPLQLLRAYAAIANGGKLMRPYIVRRIVTPDGSTLHENQPQVVATPISARTASIVAAMLRAVVDGGTGTQAKIDGIAVAGKTGTAQKVDGKTGRYSARDRMSSFVGFFPADAPRYAALVVIDSPRGATYGGLVAAPVFRRIGEYAVDRLGLRVAAAPVPQPERAEKAQLVAWRVPDGKRGMPSFIGLSMRDALVQAARAGWDVHTRGTGFVVEQDPPPGAEAGQQGRRLDLRFGTAAG